ncbi:MAG TPA: histidine phosphatase family protein [Flavobacterium sp.]|jgi:phosphohistidine phosphatase
MKEIILIRHGKSSWENPFDDFQRGLLDKGIKNAVKVALATKKFIDEESIIWSSPARRAITTAQIVTDNWANPKLEIITKPALYTFDATVLQEVIATCENNVKKLIIFGHNEAITDFVNKFGNVLIDNVPTSGFVALQMDTDNWAALKKGRTTHIIFPKDLQ